MAEIKREAPTFVDKNDNVVKLEVSCHPSSSNTRANFRDLPLLAVFSHKDCTFIKSGKTTALLLKGSVKKDEKIRFSKKDVVEVIYTCNLQIATSFIGVKAAKKTAPKDSKKRPVKKCKDTPVKISKENEVIVHPAVAAAPDFATVAN